MARHSSGQSNYALSKSLTVILAISILVGVLIAWWFFTGGSDDSSTQAEGTTEPTSSTSEQECIQGDLTLPIGGDANLVESAVQKFNDTDPVTRDFCVTAEPAGDGEAATYLFAGSREEAAAALADIGATPAGPEDTWSQVDAAQAGVAASDHNAISLDGASFPVADQPLTAATVALALAGGDEEAATAALAEDTDTTAEQAAQSPAFATLESAELPEGYDFTPIEDAEVPVWAIPVNAAEGITEDQAHAGADFADSLSLDPTVDDAALTAMVERAQEMSDDAAAKAAAEEEASANTGSPSDTLIVLDTSANMDQPVAGSQENYHTLTSNLLADLARETGGLGNQVALNNYSSPLNPGVTRGWRPNVSFPDQSGGNNAAGAISSFGTGGVPLTRAAAVAAASIGAEHSGASGREVRIVLVTTGSASDYSDEAFLRDIEATAEDKVSLHVVHVGPGEVDRTLAGYAMANGGSAVTAANTQEITDTLRAAFGF